MKIFDILNELNLENGSNYKIKVLKKYSDNELFARVLKMTYDDTSYTYGVTIKNAEKHGKIADVNNLLFTEFTLENALNYLEDFLATRKHTGHTALEHLNYCLQELQEDDKYVLERIIGRDLKINLGRTSINKVFKDLIKKPAYMRCDTYNEKSSKNINYPAIIQLKADGTYREFRVEDGNVYSRSRSGEEYFYPNLNEKMKSYPNGVYTGELTVSGISDRSEGNGLINSDNVPYDDLILELWDYITLEEYAQASKKDKKNPCITTYDKRFKMLQEILDNDNQIKIIPYKFVNSLQQALQQVSIWMNDGYEGGVLKDLSAVFEDGTSKKQLKLKLEIDCEMRITGFQDGTIGSKREGKVGALIFANDEGTIKGKCSGFTDKELDKFTNNPEEYLGKIITVKFNDLSKARGNDYYALSHPRFVEIRNDKDETDTLQKVLDLRKMAMLLK